jgi:hypothetical protein
MRVLYLHVFDILFGCIVEESIKLREVCNVPENILNTTGKIGLQDKIR